MANGEAGCHYYEQLCYNNLWLKVGDCVYIGSHGLGRHRVGRWSKCVGARLNAINLGSNWTHLTGGGG